MVEIRLLIQSVLILFTFAFDQVGFWLLFGRGKLATVILSLATITVCVAPPVLFSRDAQNSRSSSGVVDTPLGGHQGRDILSMRTLLLLQLPTAPTSDATVRRHQQSRHIDGG